MNPRLLPLTALVVALVRLGPGLAASGQPAAPPPDVVTLSVVGTNDLHGGVLAREGRGGLALFAGYVANLRKARAADGGAVLLLDAGDMFQGTLESNLNEGAAVIRAYNAIGYDAAAIGNHDFDFGPVGESPTAGPGQDPLGALKARAAEAHFPLLTANVLDRATGKPLTLPNVAPHVMVEKAGIRIGIIGVTTETTLTITMPDNVRDLMMAPLAETVLKEAGALRTAGAKVVVLAAHAGASCTEFKDPSDTSSCRTDDEIMRLVRALPPGTVDAIVAGHVHLGIAHVLNGVPILESFSSGQAFGRVDFRVERPSGRIVGTTVHQPPQDIVGGAYEGGPVQADMKVSDLLAPAVERAAGVKHEKLGPVLGEGFKRERNRESPVGNLVADWMRAARPGADLAVTNGGGLRADLPPGELTYGSLYELLPFDNRFATIEMTGRDLRRLLTQNLQRSGGLLSISGLRVAARCQDAVLEVRTEPPVADAQRVVVLTSDFLATGGESLALPAGGVHIDPAILRDEIARTLRAMTGHPRVTVEQVFDPARPRIEFPGPRPLRCDGPTNGSAAR